MCVYVYVRTCVCVCVCVCVCENEGRRLMKIILGQYFGLKPPFYGKKCNNICQNFQ